MLFPRRFLLVLIAIVALSFAIAPRGGLYTLLSVVLATVAVGGSIVATVRPQGQIAIDTGLASRLPLYVLILLAVQSAFLTFVYDQLNDRFSSFPRTITILDPVPAVFFVALLGMIVGLWYRPHSPRSASETLAVSAAMLLAGYALLVAVYLFGPQAANRTILLTASAGLGFAVAVSWLFAGNDWWRIILAFIAGLGLRVGGIIPSPDPVIDVFTLLDQGPEKILKGVNPYDSDFVSPYASERARQHNIELPAELRPAGYPAQPYWMALPLKALGIDVRYANVIADLLAAMAIVAMAWRWNAIRPGGIAATIYLTLPRVPFVIEQAWYEPMIACCLGWGLVMIVRERRLGFLILGAGLTAKQFGVPMLVPLAINLRRRGAWLTWGLFAGAALSLPFILWNPTAFYETVLARHFGHPPRTDAITIWALAYHQFGVVLAGGPLMLIGLSLIAGCSWSSRNERPELLAATVGTVLITFCLFHTKGFFNYYYLGQYLLLLSLPELFSTESADHRTPG